MKAFGPRAVVEDFLLYGWSSGLDVSAAEFQMEQWGPADFDAAAKDMLSNPHFLAWRRAGRPSKVDVRARKRLCMAAFKSTVDRVRRDMSARPYR